MRERLPWLQWSFSRVLLLVLSVTLMSAIALCILTWRLSVLDRAVAQQRDRERLEQAADSGSGALLQRLNETGERLRILLEGNAAPDVRSLKALADRCSSCGAMLIEAGRVMLFPQRSLRYVPDPPPQTPIDDAVFSGGEALEFDRRDYASAARWFADLARHSNGEIRAGALIRAARNFTKQKDSGDALAAWSDLEKLGALSVNGEPCELVASFARLRLLGDRARQTEARQLMNNLEAARWPLSRASYEYYSGELSKLTGVQPLPPIWEESVHSIAELTRNEHIAGGERVITAAPSSPVLLIWRSSGQRTAGMVLAPADIRTWLARVPGFAFGLQTLDEQILLQPPNEKIHADRVLSFANAHWRLTAFPAGPSSEFQSRETLLIAGLSLVIVLVLTGSYAVVKAVSREVAVARLQADFVSAVSHEFRSPLTTLRSMSEMLERGRVPSEERKQRYYSLMSRETERLHRLVEDLLDFGRMEGGKKQYDMREIEISTLIPQAVSEFSEENDARGFDIVIREMTPCTVAGDPNALKRAVRNVIENAVKYSAASRKVEIGVRVNGGTVHISVQDYGMGISRADLKRIFRKFERGAAARASSIQGTGLGLTMVHGILRAHGGSVKVESEENRGSTFTLLIPCAHSKRELLAWHAS
jgi:signal transduction histidine kinase